MIHWIPFFSATKPLGPILQSSFLNGRQFDREIRVERIRASRRGFPFCVLTIDLDRPAKSVAARKLAKLLVQNLRMTDEKGFFGSGSFSVLLVDTPEAGGATVTDRLTTALQDCGLRAEIRLQVYEPAAIVRDESDFNEEPRNDRFDAPHGNVIGCDGEGSTGLATIAPRAPVSLVAPSLGGMNSTEMVVDRRQSVPQSMQKPAVRFGPDRMPAEVVYADEPISRPRTLSSLAKRVIDIVGSLVGLLFVGPTLLLAMASIRLTSPGPAMFLQRREGLRGREFTIYKLRTMVVDAESSQKALQALSHRDGPTFKIKHDPRVTPIGRFLRATCIDELPQLVNVLLGDMSIVGPRPLPLRESRGCKPWHRRRLDVRPGLTCFWQINKLQATTFDEWMRLDLAYVDRGNLWTDLSLIWKTVFVAVLGRGNH